MVNVTIHRERVTDTIYCLEAHTDETGWTLTDSYQSIMKLPTKPFRDKVIQIKNIHSASGLHYKSLGYIKDEAGWATEVVGETLLAADTLTTIDSEAEGDLKMPFSFIEIQAKNATAGATSAIIARARMIT